MTVNRIFTFNLKCTQRLEEYKYKSTIPSNLPRTHQITSSWLSNILEQYIMSRGMNLLCHYFFIPQIMCYNFVKMNQNGKLYLSPASAFNHSFSFFNEDSIQSNL